jgi:hypothetical protein
MFKELAYRYKKMAEFDPTYTGILSNVSEVTV